MLDPTPVHSSGQREAVIDGHLLATRLVVMKPLDATALACEWALSPATSRRYAIAHALQWTFTLFGDKAILDHLANDNDVTVREAARHAAGARRSSRV